MVRRLHNEKPPGFQKASSPQSPIDLNSHDGGDITAQSEGNVENVAMTETSGDPGGTSFTKAISAIPLANQRGSVFNVSFEKPPVSTKQPEVVSSYAKEDAAKKRVQKAYADRPYKLCTTTGFLFGTVSNIFGPLGVFIKNPIFGTLGNSFGVVSAITFIAGSGGIVLGAMSLFEVSMAPTLTPEYFAISYGAVLVITLLRKINSLINNAITKRETRSLDMQNENFNEKIDNTLKYKLFNLIKVSLKKDTIVRLFTELNSNNMQEASSEASKKSTSVKDCLQLNRKNLEESEKRALEAMIHAFGIAY